MEYLAIIGLTLDMVGVFILGIDVITLQRASKSLASQNQQILSDSFSEHGYDIAEWPQEWRTGSLSEGLFETDGGIDADTAQREFRKLTEWVSEADNRVTTVLEYLVRSTEEQESASRNSLRLTSIGLVLIVVGFGLQILGQIMVV